MATDSSLIMDEGVATFRYKVVHIDDNIVVLNLDATDNFCFLINESSQPLSNASLEDIQWYLYHNCNIDLLSPEQKHVLELERIRIEENERREIELRYKEDEKNEKFIEKVCLTILMVMGVIMIIALVLSSSK